MLGSYLQQTTFKSGRHFSDAFFLDALRADLGIEANSVGSYQNVHTGSI